MKALKTTLAVGVLAAMMIVPDASFAAKRVYVRTAPPKPKVVVVKKVHPNKVWVAGRWQWNGRKHVWVEGRFVKKRHGFVYVQGHWQQTRQGWHWVSGRWKRI